MSDELKINSIYQVSISVDDLDAAVDFYRDKLGITFIGRFPPGLAIFDCDGVHIMLSAIPGESSSDNSVIYFNVPDIKFDFEALKARGVGFTREPHVIHSTDDYELWMAFFEDSDGNTMAIAEERGDLVA
ncbi:MAG: VOC family protein [Chloroflexi bacterium]|nr:VOC family protein [Chloroflexota bacterium]